MKSMLKSWSKAIEGSQPKKESKKDILFKVFPKTNRRFIYFIKNMSLFKIWSTTIQNIWWNKISNNKIISPSFREALMKSILFLEILMLNKIFSCNYCTKKKGLRATLFSKENQLTKNCSFCLKNRCTRYNQINYGMLKKYL